MPLTLTIEFSAEVHHGTGMGIAGLVDRAFLRDHRGVPYLAGSAIKGRFRFVATQRLALEDESTVCEWHKGLWCRPPKKCAICLIFGSPRREGAAIFEDAYPRKLIAEVMAEQFAEDPSLMGGGAIAVRHTTAINRLTRTVEPQHLFSTQTVLPDIVFTSAIRGRLQSDQEKLLEESARLLTHFGADSARGRGFCRYFVERA